MKKGSAPTAIVINAVPGVGGPSFGSGASTMRGHGIILKLALYVCIFIGLIVAVRYTGSLEQGTVRSLHEVATSDVSPTSFNEPPKAAYEKIALDELEFKTSSFKVRSHRVRPSLHGKCLTHVPVCSVQMMRK